MSICYQRVSYKYIIFTVYFLLLPFIKVIIIRVILRWPCYRKYKIEQKLLFHLLRFIKDRYNFSYIPILNIIIIIIIHMQTDVCCCILSGTFHTSYCDVIFLCICFYVSGYTRCYSMKRTRDFVWMSICRFQKQVLFYA